PTSLVAGDFTGDGQLDLAVLSQGYTYFGGASNPGGIQMLMGKGGGTFQPLAMLNLPALVFPYAGVAGNFDGDGRLDLAVHETGNFGYGASDPGGVYVLLGNGDGTFRPLAKMTAGIQPIALVAGDFTGDEKPDLAVATYNPQTFALQAGVLLGDGD